MAHTELLAELHRRLAAKDAARARREELVRKIRATLFDKQVGFIDDPAREKAALCTRRAGKTTAVPRYAYLEPLERGFGLVQLWAITRLRAKQLFWDELKAVDREFSIGCDFNETELTCRIPLGGEIRLLGADKEKETQKKRGDKCVLVVVDECQLFGSYLQTLVEDVVGPSLSDLRGTLCLTGTPGVVCAGHWYEVTRPEKDRRVPGWSVHAWSVLDNPHMAHMREDLPALKAKRGWTDDNPTYMREWLGLWVNDAGALFYAYDEARNGIDVVPRAEGWSYVLGWDLGYGDAMALAVWGWCPSLPELYLHRCWKRSGALPDEVMGVINRWRDELGGFAGMVADTGGGGKLTVEDIRKRYGLNFEPAKKTEKFLHAQMLNDDLLAGRIKVLRDSPLAEEWAVLPKDPEDPTAEDPRFDNHCADAALYAWRKARHYWFEKQEEKPKPGTAEFYAAEERRLFETRLRQLEEREETPFWER